MLYEPLLSGSAAGQVNVPDAATPAIQLLVAPLIQAVNATSIELSAEQYKNMLGQLLQTSAVADNFGAAVKDEQRWNMPPQQLLTSVAAGRTAGPVVKDEHEPNMS